MFLKKMYGQWVMCATCTLQFITAAMIERHKRFVARQQARCPHRDVRQKSDVLGWGSNTLTICRQCGLLFERKPE